MLIQVCVGVGVFGGGWGRGVVNFFLIVWCGHWPELTVKNDPAASLLYFRRHGSRPHMFMNT